MSEQQFKGVTVEGCGKGRANWHIFKHLCKGCGLCIVKCPINAKGEKCLGWSKEVGIYATPMVQPDPSLCIACGTCENVCPDSAIKVEKISK